ncbi:hypothetical protein ADK60_23575 [Streptomyces sp. XY431]|nr:hypothetical protein ADK60_23575 [Streptomyces sp. XY431]
MAQLRWLSRTQQGSHRRKTQEWKVSLIDFPLRLAFDLSSCPRLDGARGSHTRPIDGEARTDSGVPVAPLPRKGATGMRNSKLTQIHAGP